MTPLGIVTNHLNKLFVIVGGLNYDLTEGDVLAVFSQ